MSESPATPLPSATVVLLREASGELEFLLLQRTSREPERPGAWVFPGGRVEDVDRDAAGEAAERQALLAGIRETREEAGLEIASLELRMISRWITPELARKRFDTWFFAGEIERAQRVRVDGEEICDHRWLRPSDALSAFEAGELRLPPPTFVTINWLLGHETPSAALEAMTAVPSLTFRPRVCPFEGGACILYPGDAGYESGDHLAAGPRHRLWSESGRLTYERT